MRCSVALFALLAACPPRYDPAYRTEPVALGAQVDLFISCVTQSPFPGPSEYVKGPSFTWYTRRAIGVAISPQNVLSAGHVFTCIDFPTVTAQLSGDDTRPHPMIVPRNDRDFGSGKDLALVVFRSGSWFERPIAPPILGRAEVGMSVWSPIGGAVERGVVQSLGTGKRKLIAVAGIRMSEARAGTPLYTDAGELVAIASGDSEGDAIHPISMFTALDKSWVSATQPPVSP